MSNQSKTALGKTKLNVFGGVSHSNNIEQVHHIGIMACKNGGREKTIEKIATFSFSCTQWLHGNAVSPCLFVAYMEKLFEISNLKST